MYSTWTQLCWLLTIVLHSRISNVVCQQFSWNNTGAARGQLVIPQRFQLPGGGSIVAIATNHPQPKRHPLNTADGSDYETNRKLGGPTVSLSTDSVRTTGSKTFSPNANSFGRERHGHVHLPTSTTGIQQLSSAAHQRAQNFTGSTILDSSGVRMVSSMSPPVITMNNVEVGDYESEYVTSTSAVSSIHDTTFINTEKPYSSASRTFVRPTSSSSILDTFTNSRFSTNANTNIKEEKRDENQFLNNKDRIQSQTSSTDPGILEQSVRKTLSANSGEFAKKKFISHRPNIGNQGSSQIAENKILAISYERPPPKTKVGDKLDIPEKRVRKPVAQVLKRYREDNADGSITWGFENDDGSYKEETIGNDCVTRGKYGYIDPDGVRREYSYSQGLPCDKDKLGREEGEQMTPNSVVRKDDDDDETRRRPHPYIDYSINKVVLPNGDLLDLNDMVKNRARKPVKKLKND